jgi:outer membrane receptor protein involved in Fe transport
MTVDNSANFFPTGPYPIPGPFFGSTNTVVVFLQDTSEDYSVFAQANWQILDNLELAGGARWTNSHKKSRLNALFSWMDAIAPPETSPFAPAGTVYTPQVSYQNTSPEVTLTWHPNPDMMVYAAYKTGFLAGGIANPGVLSNYTQLPKAVQDEQLTFGPEKVKGFEFGLKGSWLDGRLSGAASLFHYTYFGLQVASFKPATASYSIGNAASAINQGVEVELSYAATNNLVLNGSLTYVDLHFSQYPDAKCYAGETTPSCLVNGQTDLSGMSYGPSGPLSASVGFTYDRPIAENWSVGITSDFRIYTKSPLKYRQPNTDVAAHNLLDASVRLYQNDDRWEIALIGTNLTDAFYFTDTIGLPIALPGDLIGQFNAPRQIQLQVTRRF